MAVADTTNAYVRAPAKAPMQTAGGLFDSALLLLENTAVTATGNGTAINVEGGSMAELVMFIGAVTGTSPTLTTVLAVSLDGGSNYFPIESISLSGTTEANQVIARNVFIPKPTTTTGSNVLPLVRLQHTAGGTSPSFTLTVFLRPQEDGSDKGLETLT